MKLLLDDDVPAEIAHLLHYWGHEVTVLRSVLATTASDEEVFGQACSRGFILISCNRDHFLTLARQTPDHPGLMLSCHRLFIPAFILLGAAQRAQSQSLDQRMRASLGCARIYGTIA